jgi:predicted HTH domain antitoxin
MNNMTQMAIELPESVFATLRLEPTYFIREMRIAAAIQWYAEHRISQERAAEIAGLNRFELIDELRRRKVPAIQISASELAAELGEA